MSVSIETSCSCTLVIQQFFSINHLYPFFPFWRAACGAEEGEEVRVSARETVEAKSIPCIIMEELEEEDEGPGPQAGEEAEGCPWESGSGGTGWKLSMLTLLPRPPPGVACPEEPEEKEGASSG